MEVPTGFENRVTNFGRVDRAVFFDFYSFPLGEEVEVEGGVVALESDDSDFWRCFIIQILRVADACVDCCLNFCEPEIIVVRVILDRKNNNSILRDAFIRQHRTNHVFPLMSSPRIADVLSTVRRTKKDDDFISFFKCYLECG